MNRAQSCVLALILTACLANMASAQPFRILHCFNGSDGRNPEARLVQGTDGNVYGTAAFGGPPTHCPDLFGCGAIFMIDAAGTYTVLHLMSPSDGGQVRGLVEAPDGFFYGIASRYGSGPPTGCGLINSCGTLFRIDTAGNFSVLHNFGTTDAPTPTGGLLLASDGFFYGTTVSSLYRADTAGTVTTLHSFNPTTEGTQLNGPLVQDGAGNFYGTASHGGHTGCFLPPDPDNTCGTVFQMDAAGNVTIIRFFTGATQFKPAGELILGTDGLLYGTTRGGGLAFLGGVAFQISTAGDYSVLHTFNTAGFGPEGMVPEAGLLETFPGMFYGTNSLDGLPVSSSDVAGTVFGMPANGAISVLHTFK